MPRVNPEKLADSQIYGKTKVDNNLTIRERLRKRFKPSDTVKVWNFTDTPVRWQWLPEEAEIYVIEDGSNIKITDRDDPEVWEIDAGAYDFLQGSCAYLMIEVLFKQVCAMKTGVVLHPLDEREIRNFAMDDPLKQEEFIDLVFKGVYSPHDMAQLAATSMAGELTPKITEHLPTLVTEKDEFERRNRAQHEEAKRKMGAPVQDIEALAEEFEQIATKDEVAEKPAVKPKAKAVA